MATTKQKTNSTAWGLQLRREMDVMLQATGGIGASTLLATVSAEAVLVDDGTLCDSAGKQGWAWDPKVHEHMTDPVRHRILAAGASLGRVMCGGHPSHRVYLALLEAVYRVAVEQDYDTARRIEQLWERQAAQLEVELQEALEAKHPGWVRRTLRRVWQHIRHAMGYDLWPPSGGDPE